MSGSRIENLSEFKSVKEVSIYAHINQEAPKKLKPLLENFKKLPLALQKRIYFLTTENGETEESKFAGSDTLAASYCEPEAMICLISKYFVGPSQAIQRQGTSIGTPGAQLQSLSAEQQGKINKAQALAAVFQLLYPDRFQALRVPRSTFSRLKVEEFPKPADCYDEFDAAVEGLAKKEPIPAAGAAVREMLKNDDDQERDLEEVERNAIAAVAGIAILTPAAPATPPTKTRARLLPPSAALHARTLSVSPNRPPISSTPPIISTPPITRSLPVAVSSVFAQASSSASPSSAALKTGTPTKKSTQNTGPSATSSPTSTVRVAVPVFAVAQPVITAATGKDDIEDKLAAAEGTYKDLQKNAEAVLAELKEAVAQIKKLEAEKAALENEKTRITAELQVAREEAAVTAAVEAEEQTESVKLQAELKQLKAQLAKKEQALAEAEQLRDQGEANLHKLLRDANDNLAVAQEELKTSTDAHATQLTKIQAELKAVGEESKKAAEEKEKTQQELKKVQDDLEAANSTLNAIRQESAQAQRRFDEEIKRINDQAEQKKTPLINTYDVLDKKLTAIIEFARKAKLSPDRHKDKLAYKTEVQTQVKDLFKNNMTIDEMLQLFNRLRISAAWENGVNYNRKTGYFYKRNMTSSCGKMMKEIRAIAWSRLENEINGMNKKYGEQLAPLMKKELYDKCVRSELFKEHINNSMFFGAYKETNSEKTLRLNSDANEIGNPTRMIKPKHYLKVRH